jgi:5-methyltetrahydropteroyltriglutamate--homocysteine methyltransferase
MVTSANLGFPRIGTNRELKKSLEAYWSGKTTITDLRTTAKDIRLSNWILQQEAGIDFIPSNDFSMYDQVLDTTMMLNAVPERFTTKNFSSFEELYFAMARGFQKDDIDVKPLEMTKWFDTNYHYLVPELSEGIQFSLNKNKIINEFNEAKNAGISTRPVILGPLTFLYLSKSSNDNIDKFDFLKDIVPLYVELLNSLHHAGASWVQIDEPILATDLSDKTKELFIQTYTKIGSQCVINKMMTTYFGDIGDNLPIINQLNIQGLHVDCVMGEDNLSELVKSLPSNASLSIGIVDGRNIWKNDLNASIKFIEPLMSLIDSEQLIISSSCSLLHSPIDLSLEDKIDQDIKSWMSFAKNKLNEINLICRYFNNEDVTDQLSVNAEIFQNKESSLKINDDSVQKRIKLLTPEMKTRKSTYAERSIVQNKELNLPRFPTTTIGSFPQTAEVRRMRSQYKKQKISLNDYEAFLLDATKEVIEFQDSIGLDVLVHGEFERNDMVEYFGEQLEGFIFSKNGWVQSYGSRCVKPPIIFGDVSRKAPMTIDWILKAQSFTNKQVKGMLTGPVTILQWSFVRNDQHASKTCEQIALAIRDEVSDLVLNNVKIIQIDEPALREGLPLRKSQQSDYLQWAVDCFKLSSSGVEDIIQIHTHMCYAEFNEIMDAIIALDADVISIEASRSSMELLEAFSESSYPNEIGPGVYDIHSPRVPTIDEMVALINALMKNLDSNRLWINPDCGLKTRGWDEVKLSLVNMVKAAEKIRN